MKEELHVEKEIEKRRLDVFIPGFKLYTQK